MTMRLQAALGALLLVVLPALLLADQSSTVAGLAVVTAALAALVATGDARALALADPTHARPVRRPRVVQRRDTVTAPVTHPRRPRAPEVA